MLQSLRNKFHWSTNREGDEKRRHTFRDRTGNSLRRKECLQEKRCVSMPSVSALAPSASGATHQHRSRLLRLQDRRFRHRFPQVPHEDKLLNYFSCALVSEILLQGHLFITSNHVAFYSNIFGHKTQILIPIGDVVKITKEKIAKIIPNAVGVHTESDKYVFGSMLSRDTAFRVIQQAWIHATDPGLGLPEDSDSEASPTTLLLADEDSSVSSSISGSQLASDEVPATTSDPALTMDRGRSPALPHMESSGPPANLASGPLSRSTFNCGKAYVIKIDEIIKGLYQLSRTSMMFLMSTILLIILFISTTILLYRINLLHQKLVDKDDYHYFNSIPSIEKIHHVFPGNFVSVVQSLERRIESLVEVRSTLEKLISMANNAQVPKSFSQNVT